MQVVPLAADRRPAAAIGHTYSRPIARRSHTVPKTGYWLFLILLAFTVLNFGGLYTVVFGIEYPINPITFAVLGLPVFIFTRSPRRRFSYFPVVWFFWITYTLGGFLGPHQVTGYYLYGTIQEIAKMWISLIGIPWLAVRAINDQLLPKYVGIMCLLIGCGSALAIYQLFHPDAFVDATTGGGRGAGLWINPNVCAAVIASGTLFSLMFPFRWSVANLLLRSVLLSGLAATLSRGGILAALVALVIFGLMSGRWTSILRTLAVTLFLGIGVFVALEPLKQSHIEGLAERAKGIQQMLTGGIRGQTLQGRWALWQRGYAIAKENWLRGRGHGSMKYVIKLSYLEHEGRWHSAGPHNQYIYVWGNSGLLALVALLIFLAHLLWIGLHCTNIRIRAGLVSMAVLFMLLAASSHGIFAFQFLGPIFGAFALAAHYGRGRIPRRLPPSLAQLGASN